MVRVQGELKTLARQEKGMENIAPLPPPGPRFAGASSGEKKETPPPSSLTTDDSASAQKPDDQQPAAPFPSAGLDGGDLPLFEPRAQLSDDGRQKFANYFMAGHFQNLRPLRLEKRIVRNKAIVMIVLLALALIWLFFSLAGR